MSLSVTNIRTGENITDAFLHRQFSTCLTTLHVVYCCRQKQYENLTRVAGVSFRKQFCGGTLPTSFQTVTFEVPRTCLFYLTLELYTFFLVDICKRFVPNYSPHAKKKLSTTTYNEVSIKLLLRWDEKAL